MSKRMFGAVAILAVACLAMAFGGLTPAFAGLGQPTDGELGLQISASPIMDQISSLFHVVNTIIVVITLFVLVLMVWVMFRFNEKKNPIPSRTTHNTMLEVAWTIVPILILVGIAIPSFHLLFNQYTFPKPDLTIKATGNQWYWSYEYQGGKELAFDSLMLKDADRSKFGKEDKAAYPRLLAVDNELVVPVGKTVRVLVTGADVIHAFAMPAFGVKIDAVPGRMNETWFKAEREGVYYGQCSELCGRDHAFMPISVRVLNQKDYEAWLADAKKKFATDDSRTTNVAAAETGR